MARWIVGFVPLVVNIVFAMGSKGQTIAKYDEQYGIPISCALGILLLIVGVAISGVVLDKDKAADWFELVGSIVGPVPSVAAPLLYAKTPYAYIMLPIDAFGDLVSGLMSVLSALAAEDSAFGGNAPALAT
jgi:hypothetical protein